MKILVIVDMQNDFTSGVLGNNECEEVVSKVVEVINEDNYDKIFLTRDTHQKNYLETQEGRNLPVEHCIEGTIGWQIREEIMKAVSDPIFLSTSSCKHIRCKLCEENAVLKIFKMTQCLNCQLFCYLF